MTILEFIRTFATMLRIKNIRYILLISVFFCSLFYAPVNAQTTAGKKKKPKKAVTAPEKKEKTNEEIVLTGNDSTENAGAFQTEIDTDSLLAFAEKFLGIHYRSSGINSKGFDCSGYTAFVFAKFGVKLPHTSAGQGLLGVPVKKSKAKKGDLIFFKGGNKNSKRIGHVGIVISEKNGEVIFIHSAVTGGIRIDSSEAAYYKARYVSVKRVIKKK